MGGRGRTASRSRSQRAGPIRVGLSCVCCLTRVTPLPSQRGRGATEAKHISIRRGGVVVVAGTLLGDDTGVSRHRGSGPMPSEASIHQGRWGHRPVRGHPGPHLVRVSARPSEGSMHQGRWGHHPVRGYPCPAPRAVRVSARPSEASMHHGRWGHHAFPGHPCPAPRAVRVSTRPSEASMHQGRSEHRPVRGHPCPAPRAVRVSARKSEASPYQTHGFGAHAKSGCLVGRQSAFVARCVCLVIATP